MHLFEKRDHRVVIDQQFINAVNPLILLSISTKSGEFVDGIVITRFMTSENMAAHGLVAPYFSFIGIFTGLIATGMQTIYSRAYGSGDKDKANRVFSAAFLMALVFSTGLAFLLFYKAEMFCRIFGATGSAENLLPYAVSYMRGICFGTPALVLFALLMPVVQIDGGKDFAESATIFLAVTTILLDLEVGILRIGIFWMGMTTAVARYLAAGILIAYTFSRHSSVQFRFDGLRIGQCFQILRNGFPKATRRMANLLRPILINRMTILIGGSTAMFAMSIRNVLDNFLDAPGAGIAGAVVMLTGILFGELNRKGMQKLARISLRYIVLCVGTLSLATLIFAPAIANFYARGDTQLMAYVTPAIRFMAVNLFLNAIIESYLNYLQGMQRLLKAHIVNIATRLVYVVVCVYVLGSLFGINGVWAAYPVASLLLILTIVGIAMHRKKSFRITIDDILNLPEQFGPDKENILERDLMTEEEVIHLSKYVWEFMTNHGFDRRVTYFTSLIVEEICTNIMYYGFPQNHKASHINVRSVVEQDEIKLYISDDCAYFNLQDKRNALLKEQLSHSTKNIGLCTIVDLAKSIDYFHTFNTNNVVIVIDRNSALNVSTA